MPYKDPNDPRKLKAQRNHYSRNKAKVKEAVQKRRRKIRLDWYAFKNTLACIKCGENHPATLDFHHTDPSKKENLVSKLVSDGSFTKAVAEAEKCDVLCANCHRKVHWEQDKIKKPHPVR